MDWIGAMKEGIRRDGADLQISRNVANRTDEQSTPKGNEQQFPRTQPSHSRPESVEGVREEIQRRTRNRNDTRDIEAQSCEDEIVALRNEIERYKQVTSGHTQQIMELEAALQAARRDHGDKCASLMRKIVEMKQRYHQRICELETEAKQHGGRTGDDNAQADAVGALRALLQAREDQMIEEQAAARQQQQDLRAELKHTRARLAEALATSQFGRRKHILSSLDDGGGGIHGSGGRPCGTGISLEKADGYAPALAQQGMNLPGPDDGGDGDLTKGPGGRCQASHVTWILQETLRELSILKGKAERERDARLALTREYTAQAWPPMPCARLAPLTTQSLPPPHWACNVHVA